MNNLATTFCLRRNLETGALEPDAFMQMDIAALEEEKLRRQAVAALEDRAFHLQDDPLHEAGIKMAMMQVRAKSDGAIVGIYGFKSDVPYTRESFWDAHKKWSLKRFKEFRI